MFSKKITCAIIILNELQGSLVDACGFRQVEISQITSLCDATIQEVAPILRQMCSCNYIDLVDQRVKLTCSPEKVSIYELIKKLHDGIPIGEDAEQDYHHLDYFADPLYPKIVLLEADIRDFAKKYLGEITIASLGNRQIKTEDTSAD